MCGGLKANVLVRCVGTQMLLFSGYDFLFEQTWTQYLHNLINFRTEKENCLENTLERDPTVFSRRSAKSNLKFKMPISIFFNSGY